MKAVRIQAYGDVDQLRYEDAPNPVPGAGEALVKIAVSGLNPVDLIVRKGLFDQIAPLEFPAILGVDAAGTIVAVGAGVTEFSVGDRVVAPPLNGGAYAEMVAAPVARDREASGEFILRGRRNATARRSHRPAGGRSPRRQAGRSGPGFGSPRRGRSGRG